MPNQGLYPLVGGGLVETVKRIDAKLGGFSTKNGNDVLNFLRVMMRGDIDPADIPSDVNTEYKGKPGTYDARTDALEMLSVFLRLNPAWTGAEDYVITTGSWLDGIVDFTHEPDGQLLRFDTVGNTMQLELRSEAVTQAEIDTPTGAVTHVYFRGFLQHDNRGDMFMRIYNHTSAAWEALLTFNNKNPVDYDILLANPGDYLAAAGDRLEVEFWSILGFTGANRLSIDCLRWEGQAV